MLVAIMPRLLIMISVVLLIGCAIGNIAAEVDDIAQALEQRRFKRDLFRESLIIDGHEANIYKPVLKDGDEDLSSWDTKFKTPDN